MIVKQTRLMMGMPITVEIVDPWATDTAIDATFDYFQYVDETFSTYKTTSEISRFNNGQLTLEQSCEDMKSIVVLAEQTKQETNGYFDIFRNGYCDPSGLVKGWAIYRAATLLWQQGFQNFYVDAGGDIQATGRNAEGQNWKIGIQNPFNNREIVKALAVSNLGVATSGSYVRGQHIYNPKNDGIAISDIVSLTVIGPNIYEADRFATAAFAMGRDGIYFIESLDGFEGYMIDQHGQATLTSRFEDYTFHD